MHRFECTQQEAQDFKLRVITWSFLSHKPTLRTLAKIVGLAKARMFVCLKDGR